MAWFWRCLRMRRRHILSPPARGGTTGRMPRLHWRFALSFAAFSSDCRVSGSDAVRVAATSERLDVFLGGTPYRIFQGG